jgi:hypothetical protein
MTVGAIIWAEAGETAKPAKVNRTTAAQAGRAHARNKECFMPRGYQTLTVIPSPMIRPNPVVGYKLTPVAEGVHEGDHVIDR